MKKKTKFADKYKNRKPVLHTSWYLWCCLRSLVYAIRCKHLFRSINSIRFEHTNRTVLNIYVYTYIYLLLVFVFTFVGVSHRAPKLERLFTIKNFRSGLCSHCVRCAHYAPYHRFKLQFEIKWILLFLFPFRSNKHENKWCIGVHLEIFMATN